MFDSSACSGCGTQLAPELLTCPTCQRLVHADRLRQCADEAERAATPVEALVAWRSALELLPASTRQYEAVSAKIAALGRQVDGLAPTTAPRTATAKPPTGQGWGNAAGIGSIVLVALTKGKLVLLGITKINLFWPMLLSMGVYATEFGWPLAAGLVVSIYIHEMGHVFALARYGVKASAPMFIPGLGAVIRLRQALNDPRQDARVGLAGPLWGLGAAAVAALAWVGTGALIWGAIAKLGALVNLFNLLPLGPLDGGRAFHAFNRPQRWFAVFALSLCWTLSPEHEYAKFVALILLVAVLVTLFGRPASHPDPGALALYVALAAALTALAAIDIPLGAVAAKG